MIAVGGVALLLICLGQAPMTPLAAQDRPPRVPSAKAAAAPRVASKNPPTLRVRQLPDQSRPSAAPNVRFEWDQVSGARAYLLAGRWADRLSWAMKTREYRVTPTSATRWEPGRVAFDVALPAGSHSWRLVALFGPDDVGDFENPTRFSFEVR